MPKKESLFTKFSRALDRAFSSPMALSIATLAVVVWLAFGPKFRFNSEWEDFINTVTAIFTFLAVFVIQGTQQKDTEAMQIKLDELIRTSKNASKALLDLEEMSDKELKEYHERFEALARRAREQGDEISPEENEDGPPMAE